MYIGLLQRSLDGNITFAKALHVRYDSRQEGAKDIELQGVELYDKVEVVGLLCRVIGAVHVQRPFELIVDDFRIEAKGFVVVVPCAFNDCIADLGAIQNHLLHLKIGQHHGILFYAAHHHIARSEAVKIEATSH